MGLLFEPEGLHASFERQNGKKAPGVDGVRKADYAQGLDVRVADLSNRLRRLGYRAPAGSTGVYPEERVGVAPARGALLRGPSGSR